MDAVKRELPSLMAIRAFEAAARTGSFTKAARELLVTQSAISRHVHNLEERIGVSLFARKGTRLTLTPAGREYMAAAGEAFDRIAEATAALRTRPSQKLLAVSMPPSVAAKWFTPRLADFMIRHPEVDLRIETSCRVVDLERDEVDIAIRYGRGNWPGLHSECLMIEDVFPVCTPELARGLRQVDDLRSMVLLDGDIREDWRMWLRAAGSHIDPCWGPKFNDAASLIQAAIEGLGVALGRTLLVGGDLAAGKLAAPFGLRLQTESGYWLVTKSAASHPYFARFRSWLLDQIAASWCRPCERQAETETMTETHKTHRTKSVLLASA